MEISNTHTLMIMFILFTFLIFKINNLERETFAATPTIREEINRIYNADLDAVRNLSEIALKLTTGGLTVPGNLNINGILNILSSGLVMAYTGRTDPTGWLICDGRAISKTTFSNLFSVIGVQFGDAGENFKIPNYRGAFLRGTFGTDTHIGPEINKSQGDAIQQHTHNIQDNGHTHNAIFPDTVVTMVDENKTKFGKVVGPAGRNGLDELKRTIINNKKLNVSPINTGVLCTGIKDGLIAGETRPYNFGVNWIIKI